MHRNWQMEPNAGTVFSLHSRFTGTGRADRFVSNATVLTGSGCEVPTKQPLETLIVLQTRSKGLPAALHRFSR